MGALKLMVVALGCWLCVACAGDDDRIGSGPVTLSPRIAEAPEEYLAVDTPEAFAITRDGWYAGWIHCADLACGPFDMMSRALELCEEVSRGTKCFIYARKRLVVWRGENRPTREVPTAVATDVPDHVLLRNYPDIRAGYMVYLGQGNRGAFAVAANNSEWGMSWDDCPDGPCQPEDLVAEAIAACQAAASGAECLLFALGDRIVWLD